MGLQRRQGIADRTVDNRPIGLGNGFSMAPADPEAETFTAISGILPLFTTVQGASGLQHLRCGRQRSGQFRRSFHDHLRHHRCLHTGGPGDRQRRVNVGTAVRQVPPVGSVYNVIYRESDDHYFITLTADAVRQRSLDDPGESGRRHPQFGHPDRRVLAPGGGELSAAGGYRFVPVSDFKPSGVGGLPPRRSDSGAAGSSTCTTPMASRSGPSMPPSPASGTVSPSTAKLSLVTRVAEGDDSAVPPVGSVFNFVTSGDSGFGSAHSVVPLESGDLTYFKLVTPWATFRYRPLLPRRRTAPRCRSSAPSRKCDAGRLNRQPCVIDSGGFFVR